MRRFLALITIASGVPLATGADASVAASSPGFGTPSCLRGNWVVNPAETRRVMRALIPTGGFEVNGKLYMLFRGGAFQYGSTSLVIRNTIGDAPLIARGRFFSLHAYTATRGSLALRPGESTIEYGPMTGSKDGRTYTVPGPAPRTTRVPGGTVPFQCRGSTLKVRLPRFASLDWITLRRA